MTHCIVYIVKLRNMYKRRQLQQPSEIILNDSDN